MKNGLRFLGPLAFLCGVAMMTLSLTHTASAQPGTQSRGGYWVDFDTQPTYPPGIQPLIQNLDGNLNRNGGADSAVYVPELHRLFAHYSR